LLIRIDDKLKRIKNGSLKRDDEDVVNDLIGYLVLLKISG
jgi:predicted RNA-binding protein associated with RNAse of E/G family